MAQETVTYKTATASYEGYMLKPSASGDLDGVSVLLAHDFLGPGENQLSLARKFAARGAMSFVADFYGTSIRPADPQAANAEAMRVRQNIPELRAAMQAALQELYAAGGEADKTAVIGTSVGGLAALELGRSAAEFGAIVTLWGILENTQAASALPVKTPVTLLQGNLDPLTPVSAVIAAEEQFKADQTPYDVVMYEDTAHAFTLPFVGTDVSTGFAYNEKSSQDAMQRISAILVALGGKE